MRKAATAAALLLVLIALPAGKPVPGEGAVDYMPPQPSGQAWRNQGVPICIGRLRDVRAFTPDDLETICGCAFDSYLEGHGTNPLPGLERDHIPIAMEQQLLDCTARTRPDQRSIVARLGAVWPRSMPPLPGAAGADAPKPVDEVNTGPPARSQESGGQSGGGFWEWVRSIQLPDWLTGASVLWWIAIGIFVFGLLILKLRRGDPRNDLLGPPPSMRRGAPPQPPRRPDLPR